MSSKRSVQYAVLTKPIYTLLVICAIISPITDTSLAQESLNTPGGGVKFEDVKSAAEPVTDWLVAPFYYIAVTWDYILRYPSVAILISALLAAGFTRYTIEDQRRRLRLKETFNFIQSANWDEDVVQSRVILGKIKIKLLNDDSRLGDYINDESLLREFESKSDRKERMEILKEKVTIDTIMNDYENLALGIKRGLLEEEILFQWMRGALIRDWEFFHPIIIHLRTQHGNRDLYILFEGLVEAWREDSSFINSRKLNRINNKTTIT